MSQLSVTLGSQGPLISVPTFGVWGLRCRVYGFGFKVESSGSGVETSGSTVGLRVQGLRFIV